MDHFFRFVPVVLLLIGLQSLTTADDLGGITSELVEIPLDEKTSIHSLGLCVPGKTRNVTFKLVNSLDAKVEIVGAELSCGCLKVNAGNKEVLPSGSTTLAVAVAVSREPWIRPRQPNFSTKSV